MIDDATKETMRRFQLKPPEKMDPSIAPAAQAIKQKEAGQRIYEWVARSSILTEEPACKLCILQPKWLFI